MSAAAAQLRSSESAPELLANARRRFFDAGSATWMVKVLPGEFHVANNPDEILVTILGSCVSACIRDPIAGVGGMNHFMLPSHKTGAWGANERSTRFGNFAMEKLINELVKAGCVRSRMEVKVFGGGNVTDTSNAIGDENAAFALRYLEAEGLKCAAKDLGGTLPRRIHYCPTTGRVVRRLLGVSETPWVAGEENEYSQRLHAQKPSGEIELFGGV